MDKTRHICKESKSCCCYLLADEPDENCPIHGAGNWPPRCEFCGKFLPWDIRSEFNAPDKECICTQLASIEPTVNPDCPIHGSWTEANIPSIASDKTCPCGCGGIAGKQCFKQEANNGD